MIDSYLKQMPKTKEPDKIGSSFKNCDVISFDQFSIKSLSVLFSHVPHMRDIALRSQPASILAGNIATLLFYEPSSRTFGSFSAAIKQLGGQTIDILNPQVFSSVAKGETLEDTIRVFEAYSDCIVIRHPEAGTAKKAAECAKSVPIINAGDGIGEHPTQALLDLYTIYEKHDKLHGLTGVIAGDILNGRTVHSLIRGLALYPKNTLYLLSPSTLQLTREDFRDFSKRGIKLIEITSEKEIPKNADFWYWTRVQKERFERIEDYEKVKNTFIVTNKLMKKYAGKNTILMHPLPRVGEILKEIDTDPRALYLRTEVRNGMYIRMALLSLVLGRV